MPMLFWLPVPSPAARTSCGLCSHPHSAYRSRLLRPSPAVLQGHGFLINALNGLRKASQPHLGLLPCPRHRRCALRDAHPRCPVPHPSNAAGLCCPSVSVAPYLPTNNISHKDSIRHPLPSQSLCICQFLSSTPDSP